MPLYLIERNFAEQLDLTDDAVELIDEINADEGVRWVFSFLTADRRDLLPLRGALAGGDHRRGSSRERTGGLGRRGKSGGRGVTGRMRDWAEAVPAR